MRLTSLARKIGTTPTKLLETLSSHKIDANNGINTVLAKDVVQQILEIYGVSELDSTTSEPIVPMEHDEDTVSNTIPTEEIESPENEGMKSAEAQIQEEHSEPVIEAIDEVHEVIEGPAKEGTLDDLESDPSSDIDLIKVKKVKLEGIKVVGKIDLPSVPEKSEKTKKKDGDEEPTSGQRTAHQKAGSRSGKQRRQPRKSLTYEEKLLRAEKEKKRAQKIKAKKEKTKKRQYYEAQIKSKNPTKASKKKKKVQKDPVEKQEVIVHKNPIARFWAWLNGKYDQY